MRRPKTPELAIPYDVAVLLFRYHIACDMIKCGHRVGEVIKQIDTISPLKVKETP